MSRRKLAGSAFSLVPAPAPPESVQPKKAPVAERPARSEASADEIIQLDTALVEPSPFADRLADDDHDRSEAFVKSIAEHGQQVPIRVRPHPQTPGRYQVVYGHRRLALRNS